MRTPIPQGNCKPISGGKKRKLVEEISIQSKLKLGNEVIWEIVFVARQASGPPILENLPKVSKTFWVTESQIEQVIKKLKSEQAVPSNCDKFFSSILNEILKIKIFIQVVLYSKCYSGSIYSRI